MAHRERMREKERERTEGKKKEINKERKED
jgi:hypothetical protein